MLTFLVNLESASERRARMEAQLAAAGLEAERIGVDFRECPVEEVHRWTRAHFPQVRFHLGSMCTAEAGCWAAWAGTWVSRASW